MAISTDVTTNDSEGFREWVLAPTELRDEVRVGLRPKWHDVRIYAPDIAGIGAEIWLDDVRLRGVKSYSVTVGTNEATEVTVTLLAQSVNRDATLEVTAVRVMASSDFVENGTDQP